MSGINFENQPKHVGHLDAGHVPTIAVRANEKLSPGDNIKIEFNYAVKCSLGEAQGIVNPFLDRDYNKKDILWVMINPKFTTEATHVWSFKKSDPKTVVTEDLWVSDGEDICCPGIQCARCGADGGNYWDWVYCGECEGCKECGSCKCDEDEDEE
jgi:hypothetical protein